LEVSIISHYSSYLIIIGPSPFFLQELRSFMSNPPENCKLAVGSNIRSWLISIKGANDTIYAGENFKLKIVFPKEYPSKPPSVYFLKPTPKHVHVYSNGDICLNLLGRDWRPTMTAQTLVISILSMLASAKEKKMPQDNAMHADAAPGQQQDNWMYHDDRC
jgi:ubiquitin-conjugating enzyme E2 W